MHKKPVDYSGFSFRKLNDPRFSHILLLAGWFGYFALYFITENLIPVEKCHPVWCIVDDMIPFNEYFVIIYVAWYVLVFGSLAYTLFYDVQRFREVQIFIMLTQAMAMAWYIIWPSIQLLRPAVFERQNFFTWLLGLIYAFDTPTGVCPSLHVAYTVGIMSSGVKDPDLSKGWKIFLVTFTVLVSLAVCFVKQHSFVDVMSAIPVCLIAEILVHGKYWKERFSSGR